MLFRYNLINSPKAQTLDVLTYMKQKVPIFVLTLQTLITNHVYDNCNNEKDLQIIFWIYYPFLCILCILIEFYTTWTRTKFLEIAIHNENHFINNKKNKIVYCSVTTIISLLSFIITSYYINTGLPFRCIFNYDKTIATFLFYFTFGLIFILSTIEHKVFKTYAS